MLGMKKRTAESKGKKKAFGTKEKIKQPKAVAVPRESLIEQLKSLDLNECGEWDLRLKILSWVGITALVTAAGSFFLVKPIFDQISTYESERPQALEALKSKEIEFKRVQAYQEKLTEMDSHFKQQLLQLPKESEIPELVQDVTHSARASGFSIVTVGLQQEKNTGIVIEQPISVDAAGDFRSFGRFVESISGLSRIVNIGNFTIETDDTKRTLAHMLPHVSYKIEANTYRYLEPVEPTVQNAQANAETTTGAN